MSDETHPDSPSGNGLDLPSDPMELLSDEERAAMSADLHRMATQRRVAAAESANLVLGSGSHPDSPSGQPYSAPRKAWGGSADPRNLSYEGARYFGSGYEQPNDVPWDGAPPQSYLPPPQPPKQILHPTIWGINAPDDPAVPDPVMGGGSDSGHGGKKRSWFARHKFWTGRMR